MPAACKTVVRDSQNSVSVPISAPQLFVMEFYVRLMDEKVGSVVWSPCEDFELYPVVSEGQKFWSHERLMIKSHLRKGKPISG